MNRMLVVLVMLGALALAGCGPGKNAAQTAIASAQAALDAAKDQAMKIVPDDAKAIQASIDAARALMDKGEFKAAIDSANAVPARVKAMADGMAAKKTEMEAGWEKMKEFPQALVALNAQVVKLSHTKKLPAGVDAAKVEAAKSLLGTITQDWSGAQAAYQAGNLSEAMARGQAAMQSARDIAHSLNLALPEMLK